MRKIKIEKWKSKIPIYEDGKIVGAQEKDETLLDAINVLIANKDPKEMLRGIDNFRIMNRFLELEEVDYNFLKTDLEKNIPSTWGMNQNIMKAVDEFLNAEQVN